MHLIHIYNKILIFLKINLQAFRDFEIGYQLFGKVKQTDRDVSEMLTFGLTNRSFQKMLESIPYKNNKTLWQGFVESVKKDIRNTS
jgi:hypothetical protein